MAKRQFTNNAAGKLNAGITDVATTLTLQSGQGAKFPSTATGKFFLATLIKTTGEVEVIKVTQRTGDVFDTMVRAQEGTANIAFSSGDRVELRVTRGVLEGFVQEPVVVLSSGNATLTYDDFNTTRVMTAGGVLTLPPSTDVNVGDFIDLKSLTEQEVRLVPDGADTIDGLNALWRLPSFSDARLAKVNSGQWALLRRPQYEIGFVEFMPAAIATAPRGWTFADNLTLSRTNFSGLFAVYGTTHGAGDGSTTFHKPDMRGRAPFGRDDMGGAAAGRITNAGAGNSGINGAAIGAAGGAQSVTITTGELPASGLSIPGLSIPGLSIPGLSIPALSVSASGTPSIASQYLSEGGPIGTGDSNKAAEALSGIAIESTITGSVSVAGSTSPSTTGGGTTGGGTTGGGTTGNMGSGGALNKMPPAIIGNWVIKT